MRHTIPFLLGCLLPMTAGAQLINESFETSNGDPDLTGWEYFCNAPTSLPGGAPGAGQWHARKNWSETQGCLSGQLFQRLPGVIDGDVLTLSGWVRVEPGAAIVNAGLRFGRRNGPIFEMQDPVQTNDTSWVYLSLTDTVLLGLGDTALAVLDPGLIGGPLFGYTDFDGLSLIVGTPEGIATNSVRDLPSHFDPVSDVLSISVGGAKVLAVAVLDAMGRPVLNTAARTSAGTLTLSCAALPAGAYVVRIATDTGCGLVRFIKS
ncbi:MAG: T9SS type A sorting domain-containing protein [Flavobacteriales bacterium]|nr:T9SS type A sorting domain-containing protein [Flavobacteriales bacterium]MCB9194139.1 T9SS type A sorting domain-containing protein [Flavobacteriales bacterium]